jgi:hypothetical protein
VHAAGFASRGKKQSCIIETIELKLRLWCRPLLSGAFMAFLGRLLNVVDAACRRTLAPARPPILRRSEIEPDLVGPKLGRLDFDPAKAAAGVMSMAELCAGIAFVDTRGSET